jgi:hypothetical protein
LFLPSLLYFILIVLFAKFNSNDQVNEDEKAGHAARMGEKRIAYKLLVGKPEGKRPLGRPRRRWADVIKLNLRQIGWGGMDWIDVAQDRGQCRTFVNTVMNFRVP